MTEFTGSRKIEHRSAGRLVRHRVLALSIAALACACSPTVTQHGHRILEEDLAQIRTGVTSKQEVLSRLGSPSARATFENDRWYYVTQKTERTSFYQKQLTQQDVVTVSFAVDGTVSEISRHGLDEANSIDPSIDKTRTLGNELSLIQQLLGNIGRFNSGEGDAP